MTTTEVVAAATETDTAPLPPRPYPWTRETAALVADELRRRAAWMRDVADSIEGRADHIEMSPYLDGAVHAYRQAVEHLEDEATQIVQETDIYWTAYETARAAARR